MKRTKTAEQINEIAKAARNLIHSFGGEWTFDNGNKSLRVYRNRETYDYSMSMIKDGVTIKEIFNTDINRVAWCIIWYLKS